MKHQRLDINQIRKVGFDALVKALGPVGFIRFIQEFDSGKGDYSKDREGLLSEYTVDTIYQEIQKKKKSQLLLDMLIYSYCTFSC